ncbi:mechanosensitive ion channel family protein [Hufsiella ginkgonis]|uniref:Mechanosensitive ion channel n=1 Tax=Hufsiella ginkgonis TaxID=2695274 RepID=A0A7K1XUP1_9SPHI|nr:mechanosensitive ion channel domain-containing protein [Hufsiella ginkgonis]MXV14489.1 mechanosensitive ion channel [Hufsiella ginkgonis]
MDIKDNQALSAPAPGIATPSRAAHTWFISSYTFLALGCIVFYFILRLDILSLEKRYTTMFAKISLTGFFVFLVLVLSKLAEKLIDKNTHSLSVRYNMVRVVWLVTILLIFFILVSFFNSNWYTAAVSLGLISLILGFALQTPIASLIGWLYIVIRSPYKVGDRIQLSDFTGDVVEIGYLDTTLWEFAGNYMTNDLPSGRLIRFPNSLVFQGQVYNYSWNKFPYIWNEIPFHVAYESDLGYIEQAVRRIAKEEMGNEMEARVKELRQMIEQTPVDELEIREYPFVQFRTNANTWVEVLLIYLVEPKLSGSVRSRLIKRVLQELGKEPDKAMFPKTNAR